MPTQNEKWEMTWGQNWTRVTATEPIQDRMLPLASLYGGIPHYLQRHGSSGTNDYTAWNSNQEDWIPQNWQRVHYVTAVHLWSHQAINCFSTEKTEQSKAWNRSVLTVSRVYSNVSSNQNIYVVRHSSVLSSAEPEFFLISRAAHSSRWEPFRMSHLFIHELILQAPACIMQPLPAHRCAFAVCSLSAQDAPPPRSTTIISPAYLCSAMTVWQVGQSLPVPVFFFFSYLQRCNFLPFFCSSLSDSVHGWDKVTWPTEHPVISALRLRGWEIERGRGGGGGL